MELNYNFENCLLSTHKNNQLNEYRKVGKFTDLKLRSTDCQIIEVHKNILSAACPYFEGLFNSDLIETRQELIQLVDNVTISDLEIIIEYIYTGKAEVSLENAENLYIKSQYFQLTELQEFCSKILIKNIKIDNCLDYWRNSAKYFNDSLKVECIKFIQSNCENFLEKNFTNLTAEEFKQIMAEKNLIIDQEILYEFIAKWVKEDFDTRNIYLIELIENLDFKKISDDFIETKMITDEILQNNKNFLTKLFSITFQKMRDIKIEYIPKAETFHQESLNNSKFDLNSLNKKNLKNINLITNSGIYKLDWNEWKWTKQYNFANRKYQCFATAASKHGIFISGGVHEQFNRQSAHFKLWNTSTHKINILPQMIDNRYQHKLADFKGKIYSCGGQNNNGSTEVFDFGKSKWTKGPPMNDYKYSFGLIASDDSLYTFGGFKNALHSKTDNSFRSNIVEQYDPREGKWRIISNDTPISSQAVILSNNYVYGFDHFLGRMIFDLRTNKWKDSLPDAFEKRIGLNYFTHCSDIVEFNNEIIGVFQFENSKNWATFKYDNNANKWHNLNIPLNLNSYDDIRLCVISDTF